MVIIKEIKKNVFGDESATLRRIILHKILSDTGYT